ncbi:hypothetical protein EVAR_5253_1 [Eumeta japonica]|uniref:Uncharacterized protein n=1 Tax=Eumeta variegata TaxID=151549 RepID=A0A4C1XSE2_EUMVA|nr:hypothetical protein EVAR_5253_1 [Eumeta japonica]
MVFTRLKQQYEKTVTDKFCERRASDAAGDRRRTPPRSDRWSVRESLARASKSLCPLESCRLKSGAERRQIGVQCDTRRKDLDSYVMCRSTFPKNNDVFRRPSHQRSRWFHKRARPIEGHQFRAFRALQRPNGALGGESDQIVFFRSGQALDFMTSRVSADRRLLMAVFFKPLVTNELINESFIPSRSLLRWISMGSFRFESNVLDLLSHHRRRWWGYSHYKSEYRTVFPLHATARWDLDENSGKPCVAS